MIQQLIKPLTLLIQDLCWCADLWTSDRPDLEAFAAHVHIDELLEGLHDTFDRCQEAFGFQVVVKGCCADACPQDVRTYGVQGDLLFRQVFAVGADEADRTTVLVSLWHVKYYFHDSRTAWLPCKSARLFL